MKGLEGIRVVDLSWLLPGPYATMLLADLGADVVKIEQPGKGDYTREMIPDMYVTANRNKRSLSLNLKVPAGRELLLKLVKDADILIEGFRPGVMKRLGLDYDTLSKLNPRLIYVSMSGYGQTGPYRDMAGHDIGYQSVGGALSLPADLKYPPVKSLLPIGDISSGMYACIAIQAALLERQHSKLGQYLDIAITDCVAAWAGVRLANVLYEGELAPDRLNATSRVYEASDGRYIALAISEDHFWVRFCKVIGREDWLEDKRLETIDGRRLASRELLPQIEEIMLRKKRDEWIKLFADADVSVAPVNSALEVFEDPQIKSRDLLWEYEEGGKKRRIFSWPVKFSREGPKFRNPAPSLGADTDEVLTEAGYSSAEIAALRKDGVL